MAKLQIETDNLSQLQDHVIRTIERNLANGRFQRLAASYPRAHPLTLTAYIDRVIATTAQTYLRLQALEKREHAAWHQLHTWLARRALAMLQRWDSSQDKQRDALDFAQQTCLIIYDQPFPCDISFEAWATTILKNLILERYSRSPDALNRAAQIASLDAPVSRNHDALFLGEQLPSDQAERDFAAIENRMMLWDAIQQLKSAAQRLVIIATWLDEQDDDEIARRLGKSTQAVYNLRERALKKLYTILTQPMRKKSQRKSI